MSSTNQGRQSPSLEEQSGDQGRDPNSSATGESVSDGTDNKQTSKDDLKELSSNPKGPLDDHVKEVTKKTVGKNAEA